MQWSKAGGWWRSTQCRTELNAHLASLSKAQAISACTYCLGDQATTRNTFLEIWLGAHCPQRDRLALFFFTADCTTYRVQTRSHKAGGRYLRFSFCVKLSMHKKSGRWKQVVGIHGGCWSQVLLYWKRRNFHTQINFVYLVLLAERTEFSSIWKSCVYTFVCESVLAVRKFIANESLRVLRVRNFYVYENFCDYSAEHFLLLSHVINSPGKELREENEKGKYFSISRCEYIAKIRWPLMQKFAGFALPYIIKESCSDYIISYFHHLVQMGPVRIL